MVYSTGNVRHTRTPSSLHNLVRKAFVYNSRLSNQKEDSLEGIKTVQNIVELPHPTRTSISIITPGKVCVLRQMIEFLISDEKR